MTNGNRGLHAYYYESCQAKTGIFKFYVNIYTRAWATELVRQIWYFWDAYSFPNMFVLKLRDLITKQRELNELKCGCY